MSTGFSEIGYSQQVDGGLTWSGKGTQDASGDANVHFEQGVDNDVAAAKKAATARRREASLGRAASARHDRQRLGTHLIATARFTSMIGRRSHERSDDHAWERLKGTILSLTTPGSGMPTQEISSGVPAVDDLAVDGRPGAKTYVPGFRALHARDMNGGDMIDVTAVDPASTALGMVHEVDGNPVVPSAEAVFLAVEQRNQSLL